MQDLTFVIKMERPVAELWETLGAAGVNIEASCTYPSLDGRVVRIVVDDSAVATASEALRHAGFAALDRHAVIIADIDNTPGALGDLARRVKEANVRLTTLYMAMGDRVVIASPDMDRLREVLAQ